ncbi:MAG: T9SS type A sorting domain-containing protein [Flavobacteriales bacterium]|jgi:PKD repeat protein|nr:T9SS type A sorting domain-containing protein [Flavobacteriales bacterium]MBT3964671.1 T9SS type A sorting domain-containing protein [Flavobacteriales bacterium]MBT4704004.1 T9SS type A sorting domain-containing protein [Flavobacteriales bacterium]MBT4930300.1 T9SS type A sorting domain-containing protein [Flavobacteriales bacterium]MBT5132523.1 T9SS type A sorting domain-containing protein [Flavobacteriales bacterium]
MKRIILSAIAVFSLQLAFSQFTKPETISEPLGVADKAGVQQSELVGVIKPSEHVGKTKWMKSMTKLASYDHGSPDEIDLIKKEKQSVKASFEKNIGNDIGASRAADPSLGTNFLGNSVVSSTPPDNCMAISNGGKIISSDNNTLEFYNQNGSVILNDETHEDWFDDIAPNLNLYSGIFDPRVIYDPVADRFILVILHGSNYTSSKILVCFSTSNDPLDDWNVYEFSGNALNDGSWFDYPQIGISDKDLFITGNLFYSSGGFNQAIVYQIDKEACYGGFASDYELYSNIPGGFIGSFSLVPASYGQGGDYGPGIYMVCSRSGGNNRLNFYEVTDSLGGDPELELASQPLVPVYSVAADAYQSGTSSLLNTNDCRMQHAFYLDGYVHAVHHADFNNSGYAGIIYYRIPVNNPMNVQTETFGLSGYDYTFPSISSYGIQEWDRSVMIGFLRSGSSIYPEIRVVNCDNEMDWSNSTLVKGGNSYVHYSWASGTERWGDYSDMQRRHNETDPTVWMSGCFGSSSSVWNTWVSEVTGTYEPALRPEADFEADTVWGQNLLDVTFSDSSINNPTSWDWTFPGGTPSTSSDQHPMVSYTDTGIFDVTLIASNTYGPDTMIKENYIEIEFYIPIGVEDVPRTTAAKIYPNPARTFELVHFDIDVPELADIFIDVVDMNGRLIKLMYDDVMRPGVHRFSFNKLALSPGTYFVRILKNGEIESNEKLVVQ